MTVQCRVEQEEWSFQYNQQIDKGDTNPDVVKEFDGAMPLRRKKAKGQKAAQAVGRAC